MKKIFISLVAIFAVTFSSNAQGMFSGGVHFGLPTGDLSDVYTFGLGGDLNYVAEIKEGLYLGGKVGYNHFLGDTIETSLGDYNVEDTGVVPVALTGHYNLSPEITFGTDLGIGFFTAEDSGSAFYYQPKLGYDLGTIRALLGYEGYSQDGESNGFFNLGVQFGFSY